MTHLTEYEGHPVWPPGILLKINEAGIEYYKSWLYKPTPPEETYPAQISSVVEDYLGNKIPAVRSNTGWIPAHKKYWDAFLGSDEEIYEDVDSK